MGNLTFEIELCWNRKRAPPPRPPGARRHRIAALRIPEHTAPSAPIDTNSLARLPENPPHRAHGEHHTPCGHSRHKDRHPGPHPQAHIGDLQAASAPRDNRHYANVEVLHNAQHVERRRAEEAVIEGQRRCLVGAPQGDLRGAKSAGIALAIPRTGRTGQHPSDRRFAKPLVSGTQQHGAALRNLGRVNHDIFEGTEQIQQLVISRAISGLRIE